MSKVEDPELSRVKFLCLMPKYYGLGYKVYGLRSNFSGLSLMFSLHPEPETLDLWYSLRYYYKIS